MSKGIQKGSAFIAERIAHDASLDMGEVTAIVLGGGEGKRLFPLTATRCKPAVPFGGPYRLIDVPLSNAINAGCHSIFVLTQFLSTSLHRHIFSSYSHRRFGKGAIEILSAEKRPHSGGWYAGTADAVRQNLHYFHDDPADYFLILSGDQIYNMDYRRMAALLKTKDAELVIAGLPVGANDASRMGLMSMDHDGRVIDFCEKPSDPQLKERYRWDDPAAETLSPTYLASMGIYLFKRSALFSLLERDGREDFGAHLIPRMIEEGKVYVDVYRGYWEDIGTIGSFHRANISLTEKVPPFDLSDRKNHFFRSQFDLPAAKFSNCRVNSSIVCEGSYIAAEEITHTIIGPLSVIGEGCIIRNSYLIGNDLWHLKKQSKVGLDSPTIGKNCQIERAIIDNNVTIGDDVSLINREGLDHYDGKGIYIRDRVIVVTKGVKIPSGFTL